MGEQKVISFETYHISGENFPHTFHDQVYPLLTANPRRAVEAILTSKEPPHRRIGEQLAQSRLK